MKYSLFRHSGSVFWKRRPIQLTFFVTRACNAGCPFCFYMSDRDEVRDEGSELSIDEIRKISMSMDSLLWLAFSGGEIFLRNDIVDIVRVFYENNRPAIILLPTNGLMTGTIRDKTEEILRICRKSTVALKLSLDGPEEINDRLRGVKGAFSRTIGTYRELMPLLRKYRNFELGFNTVFCSANQDYMEEIRCIINGLGGDTTHTVSLIRGDMRDNSLRQIDAGKYLETISVMASDIEKGLSGVYRFTGARLKAAQDILQREFIYQTLKSGKRLMPCYAGRLTVVLTERGDLYPCESFKERLGNVRLNGYDVMSILRGKDAHEKVSRINEEGCFCTHECYMMMNILFNPMMHPLLIKKYFRLRARLT